MNLKRVRNGRAGFKNKKTDASLLLFENLQGKEINRNQFRIRKIKIKKQKKKEKKEKEKEKRRIL